VYDSTIKCHAAALSEFFSSPKRFYCNFGHFKSLTILRSFTQKINQFFVACVTLSCLFRVNKLGSMLSRTNMLLSTIYNSSSSQVVSGIKQCGLINHHPPFNSMLMEILPARNKQRKGITSEQISFVAGPNFGNGDGLIAPRFISRANTFRVVIGDTVVLPCEVQNLGEFPVFVVPIIVIIEKIGLSAKAGFVIIGPFTSNMSQQAPTNKIESI
jgi:hypothetical protein